MFIYKLHYVFSPKLKPYSLMLNLLILFGVTNCLFALPFQMFRIMTYYIYQCVRTHYSRRLKKIRPASYARATRKGIPMAIVRDDYPEVVSREKFINIQRGFGRLWLRSLNRGSIPGSSICFGQKGLSVCYA
jgi:hypothetical protein